MTPISNLQGSSTSSDTNVDVLNILTNGEDEFDVDLMACGCRVAPVPTLSEWAMIGMGLAIAVVGTLALRRQINATTRDVKDLIRLHSLDAPKLKTLIVDVCVAGNLAPEALLTFARKSAGDPKLELTDAASIPSFVNALPLDMGQLSDLAVTVINETGIHPKAVFDIAERIGKEASGAAPAAPTTPPTRDDGPRDS